MHDGADGSGAPPGNRNALKHGRYTAAVIKHRREFAAFIHKARDNGRMMRDLNAWYRTSEKRDRSLGVGSIRFARRGVVVPRLTFLCDPIPGGH
jgi:hypothetical protein